MRQHISLLVGLLISFFFASDAVADKRVALVIGNSDYKNASKLPNPTNDAAAIAALFKAAGFDLVESRQNLNGSEMRRVIRDFSDNVRDADIAVVFYAGHGIEVDGINYLVPVDAILERDVDVEDEAIPLERLTRILEPAKRLRLVMLDACRDNPFIKNMKRTMGTRAVTRGLAKVEPATADMLIAFAAKAGSTAADGTGTNSPFTNALLHNIATPGLDLRIAFGRIRDDVMKATNNKQEPFVYGSLGGTTVALVPPPAEQAQPSQAPSAAGPAPARNFTADIRRDYELTKEIGTKGAWEAFLANYNVGMYADLAREQLAKLKAADDAKRPKTAPSPQTTARPPGPTQTPQPVPRTTESPKGGGQIACDSSGCREFKPGCRIVPRGQGDAIVCP